MDIITVVENSEGRYSWLNNKPPYSCVIASPKKEAKFKGLKSFIAYQLTPSFNNIQVSRRYKHFDWLHERLVAKFNLLPIPPLPDKQIQGRYEEEFIEHRMNQLQSFVDRMCKHPVLSSSEVWTHFLTCTDEKRWKTGKRKAEKDPLVGGSYFTAIQTPNKPIDAEYLDREVTMFTQFSSQFDAAVKNMAKTVGEQTTKFQNTYKRDYQVVGKAFLQLGQAMDQDGGVYNAGLSNAVTATGECYEEIARLYDDQPRLDWEHLGDMMHDYKGLLSGWPAVLQMHSGAMGKSREIENSGSGEASNVKTRTDTMSYALLAEINTFHEQRVVDIKSSHQRFLQEQIKFYEKITEKLQESLRLYDQCWAYQGRNDQASDDSTLEKTKQDLVSKVLNKIKTCNFKHNNVPATAKKLDPAPTFTEKLDIIDEDIYEEIRQ
jgi:sorting nexin-9/18/33